MSFAPQPGDNLHLGRLTYTFRPHPQVPSMTFGQEGRKSVVYQLERTKDKRLFALKVFKKAYQGPYLKEIAERIEPHAKLPGMSACHRIVITQRAYPDLVRRAPDLRYAVLMPWVGEKTWQDFIISREPLSPRQSFDLARNTVEVLYGLEKERVAHCDISGGNVLLDVDRLHVHLVDVEDIYGPGLSSPKKAPAGSFGYQHRRASGDNGQWCAEGDRFSGAVMLAEMLAWHDDQIRRAADKEHYFAAEEMQDRTCGRYRLMIRVLGNISHRFAALFSRAWRSSTLSDAPSLREWSHVITEELTPRDEELDAAIWIGDDERIVEAYQSPLFQAFGIPEEDRRQRVELAVERVEALRRFQTARDTGRPETILQRYDDDAELLRRCAAFKADDRVLVRNLRRDLAANDLAAAIAAGAGAQEILDRAKQAIRAGCRLDRVTLEEISAARRQLERRSASKKSGVGRAS